MIYTGWMTDLAGLALFALALGLAHLRSRISVAPTVN
jgi:hypothetical protein